MKTLPTRIAGLGLLVGVAVMCALAQSGDGSKSASATSKTVDAGNLRAFIELARSDLKTEKTLIIAQNISFTDDESVEFWPLHSEYTLELNKLLDERLSLLNDYVGTYQNLTDAQASALAKKSFDLEEKRTDLKRKYFKRFCKVVPAKKAAQFFQIENQINAALDLQLAASLPLIK
ncbi:MAG TPA: hypothetical protein VFV96_16595 [Verrucomicrobiae bacterium]|nr:hypothetical protein [Verrucomicrobiae bacterium]